MYYIIEICFKHSYDIIVIVIRLFLNDSYTIIEIPYYSFFQYKYNYSVDKFN